MTEVVKSESRSMRQSFPRTPRILSLDGGGVRGLSSLVILRDIMKNVAQSVASPGIPKPCEYFDLIGGVSTGGLIAIMLGTLGMGVDECISAYTKLSEEVFRIDQILAGRIPVGDDCCRFDYNILEAVIKKYISEKLGDENCTMDNLPGTSMTRPTFVVAKTAVDANSSPTVFRTYSGDQVWPSECALWQAARATSAAPTLFKAIHVTLPPPGAKYVDGGLGCNNPAEIALDEARRIWPNCQSFCLVSIGTGRPKANSVDIDSPRPEIEVQRTVFANITAYMPNIGSAMPGWETAKRFPPAVVALVKMAAALANLATNSEEVHQRVQRVARSRDLNKRFPYFRFNVQRDVGDIGLEDWKKMEELAGYTRNYMNEHETEELRINCVKHITSPPLLSHLQDKKTQEVLEWLHVGSFSNRHKTIRDERASNSGGHFRDYFQNWLDEGSSNLLVCHGMPGAGKSFLTSVLIDQLMETPPGSLKFIPVYIYFDYKDVQNQTPDKVIAILLKQLVLSSGSLPLALEEMHHATKMGSPRPTLSCLVDLFITLSRQQSVLVFLDGFDECDDDQQAKMISDLVKPLHKAGILIYITTRPHLLDDFKRFERGTFFEVKAEDDDIRNFLTGKLDKENISDPLKGDIVSTICAHAKGMFLLAKLQLAYILREKGQWNRYKALESLPVNEVVALEQIMNRITLAGENTVHMAFTSFSWILHTTRPLLMDELREALLLEERNLKSRNIPLRWVDIVMACQSLSEYEESSGVVRFIHPTVQEWFRNSSYYERLPAPVHLAKVCLTHLSHLGFDEPCPDNESVKQRMENNIFNHYAIEYWSVHTRGEAENSEDIRKTILDLFSSENKRESFLQLDSYDRSVWKVMFVVGGETLLHIMAEKGLVMMCKYLTSDIGKNSWGLRSKRKSLENIDSRDNARRTPLMRAAGKGHVDVVKVLLERGASVNKEANAGETPLIYAAMGGHGRVVQALLEAKADTERKDYLKRTALIWAAADGYIEVVRMLLQAKVDVESRDRFSLRGLFATQERTVVQMFIWIPDETETPFSETALTRSAAGGHLGVVKALLDAKADVNATDEYNRTALIRASTRGHDKVVEALLSAGADKEVLDKDGRTAVDHASRNGHQKVIQMLTAAGASESSARKQTEKASKAPVNKELQRALTGVLMKREGELVVYNPPDE